MRAAIESYAARVGATPTQAVRILLSLALESEAGVPRDAAFSAAALREGVIHGSATFRRAFEEALSAALHR